MNWLGLLKVIVQYAAAHPDEVQQAVILVEAIHADIQDAVKAAHAGAAS